MDKIEIIERLVYLVKQLPDDGAEKVLEAVEGYLEQQGIAVVMPMENVSQLRPEFIAGLREAEDEIHYRD
ncbi:MAG: hypothetical protein RDV48_12420 [Candidatus Eremiobacteraeota bacterium]|nr:hypothetical protein [Candidatus Eremiobacteraeota bacterium]